MRSTQPRRLYLDQLKTETTACIRFPHGCPHRSPAKILHVVSEEFLCQRLDDHLIYAVSNAATAMVLIMLPAFLFAMYEKDGLPLEKVLKNYISVHYLKPQVRVYDMHRVRAAIDADEKERAKETVTEGDDAGGQEENKARKS